VIKVPPDVLEEETVLAMMRGLAADPSLGERIGGRARSYVEREHSLQAMADGYHRAVSAIAGHDLPRPRAVDLDEHVDLPAMSAGPARDPLLEAIADTLVELGLGGDATLIGDAARAAAELGLGVGKMGDVTNRVDISGGHGR
ncbi:MAG TPA: hypothetical protein VFN57_17385, partial [Thermomicrobiaceae bacterium]|nr:hypothetical protein [Thermomicrobiaceae bacterium]